MSGSLRREAPEREAPAGRNEETQRTPPPEDYVERVRALHEVALARRELEPLVNALTAGLAWVMFELNRPEVTADVFAKRETISICPGETG
jgi:hypothetical protein